MSSEQDVTPEVAEAPAPQPGSGRGLSSRWFLIIGAVIVFNIIALIFVPPFPKEGAPGDACAFPVCYIEGTLEFPAPHVVWAPEGSTPPPASALIVFYPSISSTILTMWIVMAIVLIVSILMVRGSKLIPGRAQNVFEWFYEFLSDFGLGIAGPDGAPVHPALRRVLPAHPVLQLERPRPADRAGRRAPGADERRQHHPRARPGELHLLRVPGLQAPRLPRLCRQVLPALRVQERDRGGRHRAVRRARRAHARIRQAGHALDATLRQHLRRRGRARRHHRA